MIARSTASLRDRSRITAHYPAGDHTKITRNGTPSSVGPGDSFEVDLEFATNVEASALDPDSCITRTGDVGGVRIEAELFVGGRFISSDEFCLAQAPGGGYGNSRTISERLTAPTEPGTHDVRVMFSGANSGHDFGEYRTTISVVDESSGGGGGGDDEFTPDDDPDGNTGQCSGLVDALTKEECSIDSYVQNASQGALMTLGIGAVAFIALSAR